MPAEEDVAAVASEVAAIVMAAGAGRRIGDRPKSLLQRDGETLISRQLRLLAQAGVRQTVVVLGHHAERIQPVLEQLQARPEHVGLRWTLNPAPDEGPGSSLRCGLGALANGLAGVLVLLGDQPLLQAQDLRAVLDAWAARAPGVELVLPVHAGQPGHPLVFGPLARRAVLAASGGAGLREWRRAHPQQVQALAVDHVRCTTDIDTEFDLARIATEHGVRLAWPDTS